METYLRTNSLSSCDVACVVLYLALNLGGSFYSETKSYMELMVGWCTLTLSNPCRNRLELCA
jgi:hypothetical protein